MWKYNFHSKKFLSKKKFGDQKKNFSSKTVTKNYFQRKILLKKKLKTKFMKKISSKNFPTKPYKNVWKKNQKKINKKKKKYFERQRDFTIILIKVCNYFHFRWVSSSWPQNNTLHVTSNTPSTYPLTKKFCILEQKRK